MKHTNSGGTLALRAKRYLTENAAGRQLAAIVVGLVLGLLLPRASVYGNLTPFGVSLAATVSGPGTVLVYLAAMVGYLLTGSYNALRYLGAMLAIAGIRWSVSGFGKVRSSPWFAPLTAGLGTLITGCALLLTESSTLQEALIILSESLLAGGFAYFLNIFFEAILVRERRRLAERSQLSLIVVAAVFIASLFSVTLGGISAGRILALLCILIASQCLYTTGGCVAGAVMGTVLLLSSFENLHLVPAYVFGGLASGFFARKNRFLSLAAFLTATGMVTLQLETEVGIIISLYETVAACVFLLLFPPSVFRYLQSLTVRTKTLPEVHSARRAVAMKLAYAANAMTGVTETVNTVSGKLAGISEPEPGSLCRKACDNFCHSCRQRFFCWERHLDDLMDSFNNLTPLLREKGEVSSKDINGYLKDTCQKLDELTFNINTAYREYLIREDAFRRLGELRKNVTDQFESMTQMLREFSQQFTQPEWIDTDIAGRVQEELKKRRLPLQEVICRINSGHMELDISLNGAYRLKNQEGFRIRIGEICNRRFALPVIETGESTTLITFLESPLYEVCVGMSQKRCKGEKLCGDASDSFRDGNGRYLAILSDGMGSGGRASVDGAMTVALTQQLLKAGFGYESTLKMVNTALMNKSADESLATLDIAAVDLYTGKLTLLKAGAGPSVLISKGHLSRIEDSSLPLGILRELTFAVTEDRLTDGDILLLMSDGLTNDGLEWLESWFRENGQTPVTDIQQLADTIMASACGTQQPEDDLTVIAIQIHRIP